MRWSDDGSRWRCLLTIIVAGSLAAIVPPSWAVRPVRDTPATHEPIDVRRERPVAAGVEAERLSRSRWARRQATARFGEDTVLDIHEVSAAVHHLYKKNAWLTESSTANPLEITRAFLTEHDDLFGLSSQAIHAPPRWAAHAADAIVVC